MIEARCEVHEMDTSRSRTRRTFLTIRLPMKPRPKAVTGHLSGRRVLYEGDSMADLWSRRSRAREEHEACFAGTECVTEGF